MRLTCKILILIKKNVYRLRASHKKFSKNLRNLEDELAFLLPAVVDTKFRKAQIFCNSRHLTDLVGKEV